MLWGIKTKNSELVNFSDDQLSRIIVEKDSTQASSQSISISKKIPIKKQIQQLLRQLQHYEPTSKYINHLVQTKKYRQCIFWGEVRQNKKQGLGLMLYTNGRIYEGEWKNNMKEGKGYERFANFSIYQGAYQKGKPHGYGKYEWENGEVYQGQWVDGLKNGSGIWRGSKGDSYIGEWRNGKADGYGVHTWINGNRYEGEFKQCLKHGEGLQKFANGDTYKGTYQNGKPHGYGQYFWSNGSYYKGEFKDGLRSGKGFWKKSNQANSDTYQGQFLDEKKHGYGVFIWQNGSKYLGNFANDVRQGYGEMFWSDGNVYKGQWKNGCQVQEIQESSNLNFEMCCFSQDLMSSSVPLKYENRNDDIEFPNPQESAQFMQFQEPNHPEVLELKKFRARGMTNRMKNKGNCHDSSMSKIGCGFMICKNNFVTQAIPISGNNKSPSRLNKRPSRLSFNGCTNYTSSKEQSSKSRIRHSQSTSERKAMSVYLNNRLQTSKVDNKSSKNIPIRNFQGVELRQDTSQQYCGSNSRSFINSNFDNNSRSNVKIKPRVVKSSSGVRNCYSNGKGRLQKQHDMDAFWEEVKMQKEAILGRKERKNQDEEVKWFTRSKNQLHYC